MPRRILLKLIIVVLALVGLLLVSNSPTTAAPGTTGLERAIEVQERNTERLMAIRGVVGTAVTFTDTGQPAVAVLLEEPSTAPIPKTLDGVPVRRIVTGKIYALPKGGNGGGGKPPKNNDTTPPKAPTGLIATASAGSEIDLDWDDNAETDLSHYNVYRATAPGGTYTQVAGNVNSSAYTDTGPASSTDYYYVVRAVDNSGNPSGYSNEGSARTGLAEPPLFIRPIPIGVSTGHPDITAGTIGCRVTKGGLLYALSNNHVYANVNQASNGDLVISPGSYDKGQAPRDRIGTLNDFVPIVFSRRARNKVDAAIALIDVVDGTPPTPAVDNSTPEGSYGTPKNDTVIATIGLQVQKHGRTTGRTYGEVELINATVTVNYGSEGVARFVGQIVITDGTFSAGGDSGSLIVTYSSDDPTDPDNNIPVGLLFAGSSTHTIANPIDDVLGAFGVTIDGP